MKDVLQLITAIVMASSVSVHKRNKSGFPWILTEPKNCYRWFPKNSGHGTGKLLSMRSEILGLEFGPRIFFLFLKHIQGNLEGELVWGFNWQIGLLVTIYWNPWKAKLFPLDCWFASSATLFLHVSTSHKKQRFLSFIQDETRRIIAAGGWVEFNRVNGK